MNEEQLGKISQTVANAPVPDAVRLRLSQARQAAVAQHELKTNSRGNVATLLWQHPKVGMTSLLVAALLLLAMCQQLQKVDSSIDAALISSDVPLDALLDPALLDVQ